MDEPLIKTAYEKLRLVNAFHERFAILGASIPGFATIDGKDLKQELETKGFASLLDDGVERIQYNDSILKDNPNVSKEEIYTLFGKDYQEDVKQYYQHNLSLFFSILSSFNELIPNEVNGNDDARMKNAVDKYVLCGYKSLSRLNQSDLCSAIDSIKTTKETDLSLVYKEYKVTLFVSIQSLTALSYLTTNSMLLHQVVYEYFYGDVKKKKEYFDLAEQIANDIVGRFSPQLNNINRTAEKVANAAEQIKEISVQTLKNTQESIELEKTIISNQVVDKEENSREHANIQEEVNKKQRLERTKPLKLSTCLEAIRKVYLDERYDYPKQFKLHEFAIQKTLSAWNQYLKTEGEKGEAPLPGFDYYRHTDEKMFKEWIKDTFFPYYRNNSHKDALNRASHPKNMDQIPSQQDVIAEVDEALNDDRNIFE